MFLKVKYQEQFYNVAKDVVCKNVMHSNMKTLIIHVNLLT